MAADLTDPDRWIAAYAERLGLAPPDRATVDELLELAAVAAHASARTAAPIACWLVGTAGLRPAEALRVAQGLVEG